MPGLMAPNARTVTQRMGIVEAVRKYFHGLLVLVLVLGHFLVASRLLNPFSPVISSVCCLNIKSLVPVVRKGLSLDPTT